MDFNELKTSAIKASIEAEKAIKYMKEMKVELDKYKKSLDDRNNKLNALEKELRYKEIRIKKILLDKGIEDGV